MKNRGRRRSKAFGSVAVATALGFLTGTGPMSVAFAQGAKKAAEPTTGKAAADAATRPPTDEVGRRIGLRDALKLAVRQNPTLASSTVDVGIADAQIKQTYGLDDWLVAAGANWTSARTKAVAGVPVQNTAFDKFDANVSIVKPLVDGGRIGLTFDSPISKNTSLINIPGVGMGETTTTTYTPLAQITFFQPILRGFGEKTRNVTRSRAVASREVFDVTREGAASNVVRDVVQAYWELAFAAQDVEIRKQSVALAREQLRITQAGIDVGKLAKTESLAIEQAIASREEELLTAEQNRSERAIELRRLIGMEIGPGEIDLTAVDHLDTGSFEPDLDKTLATAMENNAQLRVVRAQGKAASIDVEVTENGLLPQLDFTAAAGPQGNSDSFGTALKQMGKFDTYAISAGLTFSTAIGNDTARGAHEVAQGNLRKVKLTEADIRSQIAAQVVRAVNLVRSAKKRMEVSAKASGLAAQNVDLEKARWEVGRTTNFEVLKRQDELAQSQLAEARAHADYLKAVSVLDSLTGEILTRYGIALSKS